MDSVSAKAAFVEHILGRWPDFEISSVLMDDWIALLRKFNVEDVAKAAKQYVLNHSQFKKPDLFKFKEIINGQCRYGEINRVCDETWPKYFLQCVSDGQKNWLRGTFTQIVPVADNPDMALKIMHQQKKKYEACQEINGEMVNCGGNWNVVICQNRKDFGLLIESRTLAETERKNT